MTELTIYHNTNCSMSRHAMDVIEQEGAEAEVVQYLRTPLDRAGLLELIAKVEDPPADIVRKDDFSALRVCIRTTT